MKKLLSIVVLVAVLGMQSVSAINVVGNIMPYTTGGHLLAGNYVVIGNTWIPAMSKVIVDPGVVMQFGVGNGLEVRAGATLEVLENTDFQMDQFSYFKINGDFFVKGVAGAEATFRSLAGAMGGWNGFITYGATINDYQVSHALISDISKSGTTLMYDSGPFFIYLSSFVNFKVTDSHFKNNSAIQNGGVFSIIQSSCSNDFVFVNNIFESNNANNDGGVIYINTDLTNFKFENNGFDNNIAYNGGAIFVNSLPNGKIILEKNVFSNNTANNDGGSCFFSGGFNKLEINENTFRTNTAIKDGGAINFGNYTPSASTDIFKNIFEENKAVDGGAVSSKFGQGIDMNFFNNLIVKNKASNKGGGVLVKVGYNFINNTFSRNRALIAGAVFAVTAGIGTYGIRNNIFWANGLTEVNTVLSAGSVYPNFYYCDIKDTFYSGGSTNINSNPKFVSSSDFHLKSFSPCKNTGEPAFSTTPYAWSNDLDNTVRVKFLRVDMGAYEFGIHKNSEANIEENIVRNKIKIYPNPATSIIHINLFDFDGSSGIYEVVLFDLSGERIRRQTINSTQIIDIDVTDLNSGVYFIRITSNDKSYSNKLIIN